MSSKNGIIVQEVVLEDVINFRKMVTSMEDISLNSVTSKLFDLNQNPLLLSALVSSFLK